MSYKKAGIPTRRNAQKFAEGGAVGDDYNTPLSPDEERGYADWKKKNAPNDSGYDYDLRGAYKAGEARDPGPDGHMKDRFKKPNHPTFSDESQYATGAQRDRAGHWVEGVFVPPANK